MTLFMAELPAMGCAKYLAAENRKTGKHRRGGAGKELQTKTTDGYIENETLSQLHSL